MNKYYFSKVTNCFYSGIVIAENEEAAREIAIRADLDDCFCEETCAELAELVTSYAELDEIDVPVLEQTENGYTLK